MTMIFVIRTLLYPCVQIFIKFINSPHKTDELPMFYEFAQRIQFYNISTDISLSLFNRQIFAIIFNFVNNFHNSDIDFEKENKTSEQNECLNAYLQFW